LQNCHGQRVGAEGEADQELRGGELEPVKGEDRQDEKQAQHAQSHHAGERQKHFLLRRGEREALAKSGI
jgi:hypothetical protein